MSLDHPDVVRYQCDKANTHISEIQGMKRMSYGL